MEKSKLIEQFISALKNENKVQRLLRFRGGTMIDSIGTNCFRLFTDSIEYPTSGVMVSYRNYASSSIKETTLNSDEVKSILDAYFL